MQILRMQTRTQASRLFGGLGGLMLVALGACRDVPTDPLASLATAETAASIDIPIALPSLADLAQRTGVATGELAPWVAVWQGSWATDAGSANDDAAREEAVRRLVPVLADSLGLGGAASVLAPLLQVDRDLSVLDDVPGDLMPQLLAVRSRVDEAREALAEGRTERALEAGLMASDQLRGIGPLAVARTLIARADRALMATLSAETLDGIAASRGERMLDGARVALENDDPELAVQRAFYAVQLLEQAVRGDRVLRVDTIG